MEINNKETIVDNGLDRTPEKNNCILMKIKYKPIILESIYSFSRNRPYILIDLISNDKTLKSSLKKIFNNTKRKNELSLEFNDNINIYISYRKIKDRISMKADNIENNVLRFNEYLNSIIQKPSIKTKFFENIEVKKFINKPNIKAGHPASFYA